MMSPDPGKRKEAGTNAPGIGGGAQRKRKKGGGGETKGEGTKKVSGDGGNEFAELRSHKSREELDQ